MNSPKITPADIRAMKARGEKIAALTAYDFPIARLLDECGVPLLLVGDSLGMVVLGYPNTTGLSSVHYRITDQHADPVGLTERYHSEKLMRLPESRRTARRSSLTRVAAPRSL
jgi:hypothetical protein